jgi:DNA-directed RNA polymerase specialized sigma24 family protein
MTSPSPSDLCWVIGFTPNGRWIAPVMRAAVRFELQAAREIAASHLGNELLASEIMEQAILETAEHLADLNPIGIDETRAILTRFYRSEVRRRQRADSRFSFRGTSTDIEFLAPSTDKSFAVLEAELDLEKILRDTPTDLRRAMLLRYGARSQWKDVATVMAKSPEAARKICGRELKHIRKRLGL